MNCKITFLLLAALNLVSLSKATADIYVTTGVSRGNDGAEVSYTTSGGFNVVVQGGAGGYSFAPDAAPGHQAFFVQTAVSGTSLFTRAFVDAFAGVFRVGSFGGQGGGGNRAQIVDSVTFHNPTGQPQPITFVWNIDGTMAVSPDVIGRANYHGDFRWEGPGTILRFVADAEVNADATFSSASNSASASWDSYSCQPRSGGYGGIDCNGNWTMPVGDYTFGAVNVLLDTNVRCDGASCAGAGASSDFGNTGKLRIAVPAGVSFTSQSGVLLTGVTAVSRMTHGNGAGAFDVPLPLTGTPGVECRRGAVAGQYQIVVTFANPPNTVGAANVTLGAGQVQSATLNGSEVTMNVTGLTNSQTTVITLHDVHNGAINGDVSVPISLLLGDVSGDGSVNSADATIVRNRSGQGVNATTFRADINADGFLDSGDATIVRNASGSGLPAAAQTKRGSLAASPSELVSE